MTHAQSEIKDTKSKNLLPHTSMSVDDCSGQNRFEKWRETMVCLYNVEADKAIRDDSFYGHVDAYMMDSIMLVETRTREMDWYRTPHNIANDGIDHILVQLFDEGRSAYIEGNCQNMLPEGGIQIKSLAETAHTALSDFKNKTIAVRRDLIEPWLQTPQIKAVQHLPANAPLVHLLRNHMQMLWQLLPNLTIEEGKLIAPQTLGMITACLNGHAEESQRAQSDVPYAQIAQVKTFIENNLPNQNLSPNHIARATHVSRSKLYRMFDSFGGVASYIRQRRLMQAARKLGEARAHHRPVYEIALACGFENASSFSRQFKDHFEISPTEFRKSPHARENVSKSGSPYDNPLFDLLHNF